MLGYLNFIKKTVGRRFYDATVIRVEISTFSFSAPTTQAWLLPFAVIGSGLFFQQDYVLPYEDARRIPIRVAWIKISRP